MPHYTFDYDNRFIFALTITGMDWKYLSDLELKLIKTEHASGKSGREIARLLNRNPAVINRCIKRGVNHGKWSGHYGIAFRPEFQRELGEFMGVFAGDGNINRFRGFKITVFLNSRESEYAMYLSDLSSSLFGKPFHLWEYRNMIYLMLYGKKLEAIINDYLKFDSDKKVYTIGLKHAVKLYSEEFLRGFAAGLICSDGYIGKKYVRFSTTSNNLTENYQDILNLFGISHSTFTRKYPSHNHDCYDVDVKARSAVKRFYNTIEIHEMNRLKRLQAMLDVK